ncbi:MAG: hypothetical protein KGP29_05340 [Proteobacteria bacterium]|nr:hypothetical protein [Pseudomonadota bacterium]
MPPKKKAPKPSVVDLEKARRKEEEEEKALKQAEEEFEKAGISIVKTVTTKKNKKRPDPQKNQETNKINSEFLISCRMGMFLEAKRLIELGANLQHIDDQGNTALHFCSAHRSAESLRIAEMVADANPSFINLKNKSGLTPAALCCTTMGSSLILNMLLERGLDKNSLVKEDRKDTLLHSACYFSNLDSVMVLIAHGVDIDAENSSRLKPFQALDMEAVLKIQDRIRAQNESTKSLKREKEKAEGAAQVEVPAQVEDELKEDEKDFSEFLVAQSESVSEPISEVFNGGVEEKNDEDVLPILSAEQKLEAQRKEMDSFLEAKTEIRSVYDLPSFLLPNILELIRENVGVRFNQGVQIKGSRASITALSTRFPSDLDLEVFVVDMRFWSDEKIQEFARRNFDLESSSRNIYRGPHHNGSAFTVNIKDENRRLDFSFYDPKMLPPHNLSWATNKEKKVLFDAEGNAYHYPALLASTEWANHRAGQYSQGLIINPEARGLMLRLCFLASVGEITRDEILEALPVIKPDNPVDLLQKEFKLDKLFGVDQESIGERTQSLVSEGLERLFKSHNLDRDQQRSFLENLDWVSKVFYSSERNKEGFFHELHLSDRGRFQQNRMGYFPLYKSIEGALSSFEAQPSSSPLCGYAYRTDCKHGRGLG